MRSYRNNDQKNWVAWLLKAEFAYNNLAFIFARESSSYFG